MVAPAPQVTQLASVDFDKEAFRESLWQAVQAGDVAQVDAILPTAPVTILLQYQTHLCEAASKGHTSIVKRMIDAGMNPCGLDPGNVPLVDAAKAGHVETVRLLLQYENVATAAGTALIAAYTNDHGNVEELLESAVPQSNRLETERSLFYHAISKGDQAKVLALWSKGIGHPTATTKRHPFYFVADAPKESLPIAELFLKQDFHVNDLNDRGETALSLASARGHAQIVRLLLSHGANVNLEDQRGATALIAAMTNSRCDVAMLLLDQDAEVNVKDWMNRTPLMLASQSTSTVDCPELVERMLVKGADVHAYDQDGNTALILANSLDKIRRLLAYGANVNHANKIGVSALAHAAEYLDEEAVEVLLNHGAELNSKDSQENTILLQALFPPLDSSGKPKPIDDPDEYHTETVRLLVAHGAAIDSRNKHGNAAIHLAANLKNTKVIELLLDRGGLIDEKTEDGESALMIAARSGSVAAVKLLLERGADVNIEDSSGYTAVTEAYAAGHTDVEVLLSGAKPKPLSKQAMNTMLLVAIKKNDLAVVKRLLSEGADANAQAPGNFAATALIATIAEGNQDIVEQLLQHGADVHCKGVMFVNEMGAIHGNAIEAVQYFRRPMLIPSLLKHVDANHRQQDGAMLLHIAARGAGDELAISLLELGADINAKNAADETPLDTAIREGNLKVVKLLLAKGGNFIANSAAIPVLIDQAGNSHDHELVPLLVKRGWDMSRQSENGDTVLHRAVDRANLNTVALLLEAHADVNAQNKAGMTPLHLAAIRGFSEIAKTLLENGARFDVQNAGGYAPIHLSPATNNVAIVQALVDGGSPVELADVRGATALYYAVGGDKLAVAKYLLDLKANVNAATKNGATPLHFATFHGRTEAVKFLLEHGAAKALQDADGNTPLHVARARGHLEIVKLLQPTQ